jgi:hypothetical protein
MCYGASLEKLHQVEAWATEPLITESLTSSEMTTEQCPQIDKFRPTIRRSETIPLRADHILQFQTYELQEVARCHPEAFRRSETLKSE